MEHLDTSCLNMLTGILTGQARRRYEMTTIVTDAWERGKAYRLDFGSKVDNTSVNGEVWKRHRNYDPKASFNNRFIYGYSITSIENGWVWFADADPTKPLSLKKHMTLLNIPEVNEVDMIYLNIETNGLTTEKGNVILPETFKGWLFDPKNYFWAEE